MGESILTAERLRELLHYDPETGVFTRLVKTNRSVRVGDVAGSKHPTTGYLRTRLDSKSHLVHRLIWLWVHGEWPPHQIDHINGIRDDNRLCNLRCVTHTENRHNLHAAQRNSKSGVLGVHWCKDDRIWQARLTVNGEIVHSSLHNTIEAAAAARRAAEMEFQPIKTAGMR